MLSLLLGAPCCLLSTWFLTVEIQCISTYAKQHMNMVFNQLSVGISKSTVILLLPRSVIENVILTFCSTNFTTCLPSYIVPLSQSIIALSNMYGIYAANCRLVVHWNYVSQQIVQQVVCISVCVCVNHSMHPGQTVVPLLSNNVATKHTTSWTDSLFL